MMKQKKYILYLLAFIIFSTMIMSCSKDEDFSAVNKFERSSLNSTDKMILGQQLNVPYNVIYMQQALQTLRAQGIVFPFSTISPTNKYVRITSYSSDQTDIIEDADTNIIWFEYPLDYEIINDGRYYHDSNLPDSVTYLYGVVPINYNPPAGVPMSVFFNVFIPENHPHYKQYQEAFSQLEQYANILCGNEQNVNRTDSKWTPSIQLAYYDDTLHRNIPLKNIKVTIGNGFKSSSGYTDESGFFQSKHQFKGKVNYSFYWKDSDWKIMEGRNTRAHWSVSDYDSPISCIFNSTYSRNNTEWYYSAIQRAANIAFGDNNLWTIHSPKPVAHKLKICLNEMASNIPDELGEAIFDNSSPYDVILYSKLVDNSWASWLDIFSTSLHEFTHWSHRRFMGINLLGGSSNFNGINPFIYESWATCVQMYITTQYYYQLSGISNLFGPNGYLNGFQHWNPNSEHNEYTPVFYDLMDDNVDYETISGYSLSEIQDFLRYSYGATKLCENLQSEPLHGATVAQIEQLMHRYQDITYFN